MINVDMGLWKKVQDDFSTITKTPIVTIDHNGNEVVQSGVYPFFCELIKSKSDLCKDCRVRHMQELNKLEVYECHAGLTNVMAPIFENGLKVGAIIFTSILENKNEKYISAAKNAGLEAEELKDEFDKLKLLDSKRIESYVSLLEAFSKAIPELAYQSQNSRNVITELNTVRKLSNVLDSSLDLDSVVKSIMEFFVESFKLNNCSITLFSEQKKYSYREADANVENSLINLIQQTNHLVDIRDSRNSFLLNSKYNGAILALPLRVSNKTIGAISIYSENPMENMSLFSTLAEQISLGVMNALNYKHISEESITDNLTSLYNRNYFNTAINKELARSSRVEKPISLIILDIDDFKKLNDSCGHLKGDQVLRDVAYIVKNNIRTMDSAFRYGGEEFIVLLPETESNEAGKIAERIRKSVEEHDFIAGEKHSGKLTVSLGLVTCNNSKLSAEKLLKEADSCLYKAKNSGKNKAIGSLIVDERINAINLDDVDKMYKKE